jgi:hypothetical protein
MARLASRYQATLGVFVIEVGVVWIVYLLYRRLRFPKKPKFKLIELSSTEIIRHEKERIRRKHDSLRREV